MISNPLYLVSILVSSLIAFATVVVIVEASLALFRVERGRIRSLLRTLPFFSLLTDLRGDTFSIGYWFNPLSCSSCVQKVLLHFFFPELKEYLYTNEISLLRYLGSDYSHTIFFLIFVLCISTSVFFSLRKLFEGFLLSLTLRSMTKYGTVCKRPIVNVLLANKVLDSQVKIYVSAGVKIPMATYSKAIFLPQEFVDMFSQEEFEAVVAHELDHIHWRDPLVRFCIQQLSAICWWVPTRAWMKRMELDQEIACDQSVMSYGFEDNFLASALVKVASMSKGRTYEELCYLSNDKSPSLKRLQIILGLGKYESKHSPWESFAVIVLCFLVISICILWL